MSSNAKHPETIQYFSGGMSLVVIAGSVTVHIPITPDNKEIAKNLIDSINLFNTSTPEDKPMMYAMVKDFLLDIQQ